MFHTDYMQFYPTPLELGKLAWSKFQNRNFVKVLEPSAGDGALVKAHPHWSSDGHFRRINVDVLEADVTKHDVLRKIGVDVVGLDFLQFSNGAQYSHIILNPPFNQGVHHVLKAWDILWNGEVVAILNAESVKNPFSKERQHLVDLIERHGSVEFIKDAFQGTNVVRTADVEIALIWLRKEANLEQDLFGDMLEGLAEDGETGCGLAGEYQQMHEVALPNSVIENRVAAFRAAVKTMQAAVFAEAKAAHYSSLLGQTMAERMDNKAAKRTETTNHIVTTIASRYAALKDAAWAGILRSSNVTSRLSSKAQKRVESEFERIKKLEFSTQTIYGFLLGIVESQGELQLQMACDVFDELTKYHSNNTVHFKGWKSNDRHRTCGMRIKHTRIVLPYFKTWCHHLDWDAMQKLRDLDKVFAMLDGKTQPEVSLESIFTNHLGELVRGARISGSYFDVRYFQGTQTVHFFVNKKNNMVDRLNRLVGRHREWLPPSDTPISDNFWLAYDSAERYDAELRQVVAKTSRSYDSPFHSLNSSDEMAHARAADAIVSAIESVLESKGISPHFTALENSQELKLLAA